ncbi:hypothetical protein [Streptomyces sp. NPDC001139]
MPPEVIDLLAHMSPARAVCLALGVFGSSAFVWLLAVEADYAPAWRATKDAAREAWVQIALTAAALLILTIPTGDHR